MRVRTTLIALAATSILALPATAVAAGGSTTATDLTGAAEVPGPGDPDASGDAVITLNQGRGTICYDLSWADIDGTVTAAHLHEAPAGSAAPVAVGLFGGGTFLGTDSATGCVTGVDRALVKEIRKDPASYYVNVHSDVFPAGAIRGQLG